MTKEREKEVRELIQEYKDIIIDAYDTRHWGKILYFIVETSEFEVRIYENSATVYDKTRTKWFTYNDLISVKSFYFEELKTRTLMQNKNAKINKIQKSNTKDNHMKVCEKLNKIYKQKNHDYGDSFGETYKELGLISCITRMNDKMNRLKSLAKNGNNEVKDESISDTLLDLANYSIMTYMCLQNDKKGSK